MSALRISLFSNRRDTIPDHVEVSFRDLALISHTERAEKDGALFSPAEYRAGESRGNAGVLRLHCLVIDLDHLRHDRALEILEDLFAKGLETWVYSTHSYDEDEAEGASLRVVIKISRPVVPDEWRVFWAQAIYEIAPECDPARKDLAGMYYLPSCKPHAPRVNVYTQGEPLDVDALLERASHARGRVVSKGDDLSVSRRIVAPVIDDAIRTWALERVSAHAARVERTPEGPIYPVLNHAAFVSGRFVPHVLSLDVVRAALHTAHARRNPDPIKIAKNDGILDRGLADGMAVPWKPARPYELTDEGLSDRLRDEHGTRLRYVTEWSKWIGYDGKRWVTSGDSAPAFLAVRELTAALRDESEYVGGDRGKALRGASRRLASAGGAASVVRMAVPLDALRIRLADLDPHPMFLACANGTIDLERGALIDHDPEHMISGATPIAYDSTAACPTWDRFMREVCDDDLDLVTYLQRAVGYSLTARTDEQCLFFLYGNGGAGKSTFLGTVQHVLGDYATTCSADLILTKRHEQHPTAIAALFGKRLAIVGEVDDGRSWDEATVKSLTGSDVIAARRMREDMWTFTPRHKLWIAGNYRPSVRGIDNGIWRRMRLVPFTASFKGREDRALTQKLQRELPGILAWAVRGAQQWARYGLETPERVQRETDEYRIEQDFFRSFFEESFELTQHAEDRVARSQLVQLYEQWRIRNGMPQLGARSIAERARANGAGEVKASGITYWTRIKMRPRHEVRLPAPAQLS